jgi:Dihydrofolate reductase
METAVFCGVSLDGFIARANDELDWLMSGSAEKDDNGYKEFIATIDAIVIGRRTYDVVLGFGGWFYGKMPVFVLSTHELDRVPAEGVIERLSGELGQIYNELEERGFKRVYVDGGKTVQQFLRAGLIDRITISRLPVLIGTGIPLFGETEADIRLKLERVQEFPSGMVQCEYSIGR